MDHEKEESEKWREKTFKVVNEIKILQKGKQWD